MFYYKYIAILIILASSLCVHQSKQTARKHVQIELQTKGCGSRSQLKVQNNLFDIGTASVAFDNNSQFTIKYKYAIKTNQGNTLHIHLDLMDAGVSIKKWSREIVLDENFEHSYQPFENVTLNVILID